MRQYLDGRAMDDVAIERIRTFEADALRMSPDGYHVANSGGKDSTVIRDLFLRSGCVGSIHHNLTTVDPPEVIYFLREHHPETIISKPEMTMWQLIRREKCPPTRPIRYCCKELKERGGDGRLVITGIRWEESNRRGNRQMTEACHRDKTRRYLHPIIDWSAAAVWEYIRSRDLPYCGLYDEGMKRVGCVLCPMNSNQEEVAWQAARWPRLAAAWKRAIDANCTPGTWDWWLNHRRESRKVDSDPVLFEDDPSMTGGAVTAAGEGDSDE